MSYDSMWTLQWTPIEKLVDCGHGAPEDARFCPRCGAKLIQQDPVREYIKEKQRERDRAFDGLYADGETGRVAGWYDWEDDMAQLSMVFPDVVFELGCKDREDGETDWIEYWVNGKVQHEDAVVTYGEFDPKKLEDYSAKA